MPVNHQQPHRDRGLARIVRACAGHPWRTFGVWLAIVVAVIGVSTAAGGKLVNNTTIPGSEAQAATDLLELRFPEAAGDSAQVVFSYDEGHDERRGPRGRRRRDRGRQGGTGRRQRRRSLRPAGRRDQRGRDDRLHERPVRQGRLGARRDADRADPGRRLRGDRGLARFRSSSAARCSTPSRSSRTPPRRSASVPRSSCSCSSSAPRSRWRCRSCSPSSRSCSACRCCCSRPRSRTSTRSRRSWP